MRKIILALLFAPMVSLATQPLDVCTSQTAKENMLRAVNSTSIAYMGIKAHSVVDIVEVSVADDSRECFGRVKFSNGEKLWIKYTIFKTSKRSYIHIDAG